MSKDFFFFFSIFMRTVSWVNKVRIHKRFLLISNVSVSLKVFYKNRRSKYHKGFGLLIFTASCPLVYSFNTMSVRYLIMFPYLSLIEDYVLLRLLGVFVIRLIFFRFSCMIYYSKYPFRSFFDRCHCVWSSHQSIQTQTLL